MTEANQEVNVRRLMKIYLHQLDSLEAHEAKLEFTQDESWVRESVSKVDELYSEKSQSDLPVDPPNYLRKIHFSISLRKVDEVVFLSGQILAPINTTCSRCAGNFDLKLSPKFSALYCQDPEVAGIAYMDSGRAKNGERKMNSNLKPSRRVGTSNGLRRQARGKLVLKREGSGAFVGTGASTGFSTLDENLDITYLINDYIDLGDVLVEQLQLQMPYQPLCKEDCLGICGHCGVDLNFHPCNCGLQPPLTKSSYRFLEKETLNGSSKEKSI